MTAEVWGPSAKIIEDSVSPAGDRLTTMQVVCHRFVLAEFNTHRMFSRNSASSRAIPFQKMLNRVLEHPAIPVTWPAEQKGMQGGDEIEQVEQARVAWLNARDAAVRSAIDLADLGVHKSVVNRLLEPFMWHTIVVSSTEWDNFFVQRCSPLAQPEIQAVAYKMRDALRKSTPEPLAGNEWHMPYVDEEDFEECRSRGIDPRFVSAARCARVSYLTQEGKRDVLVDAELYQRLVSADPPHMSPLEHVATPRPLGHRGAGNFHGWDQLRHIVWSA